MHSFHFDDQYNTFHSYGYAVAPGSQSVVGDEEALAEKKGACTSALSRSALFCRLYKLSAGSTHHLFCQDLVWRLKCPVCGQEMATMQGHWL